VPFGFGSGERQRRPITAADADAADEVRDALSASRVVPLTPNTSSAEVDLPVDSDWRPSIRTQARSAAAFRRLLPAALVAEIARSPNPATATTAS
jgi:hypothetical protein